MSQLQHEQLLSVFVLGFNFQDFKFQVAITNNKLTNSERPEIHSAKKNHVTTYFFSLTVVCIFHTYKMFTFAFAEVVGSAIISRQMSHWL